MPHPIQFFKIKNSVGNSFLRFLQNIDASCKILNLKDKLTIYFFDFFCKYFSLCLRHKWEGHSVNQISVRFWPLKYPGPMLCIPDTMEQGWAMPTNTIYPPGKVILTLLLLKLKNKTYLNTGEHIGQNRIIKFNVELSSELNVWVSKLA